MSAVSDWIVREYFEIQGFLVTQPRKYQVAARAKRAEEEIDLLVAHPDVREHEIPETMIWDRKELKEITRAIVSVRGWHTDRFSPAMLRSSPELFRFTEEDVEKKAARILGPGPLAKILCLPALPAGESSRKKTLELLKEQGVDGVIYFSTLLQELIAHVDVKKNYEKSDLLQILRILKNYDLLKDAQMELFSDPRRRKRREQA